MNANELANLLEVDSWYKLVTREEIATMLRQQQEKLTKYELRHVVQRDRIAILEMQHKQQQAEIEALKAKTLTDEEIMVLYEEYIETQYASESNVLGFGRAILRKAQENGN